MKTTIPRLTLAILFALLLATPSFAQQTADDAKNAETVKNNILKKQLTTAAELFKTGNEQMGQKNYDEAIVSFTKCIEAFPTTVECYNNRAILNAMKENYDAVISDYTTVLLFKKDADVYYRRGLAYRDKNDLDAAVKDFTQALMLNRGENPDYFMDRGATYIYKQDAFSAVSDFTQAIKLNQQESRYYFLRGYAHQGGGNKEAAIADYKQALELNPKLEPAKKMLQELGVQAP